MKKKILVLLVAMIITLPGCALHEHKYVEKVIKEAECEKEGQAIYKCWCGDSYEAPIPAKEHEYGEYTYKNNATYDKNGTEYAVCKLCGKKHFRQVEGSKLERVFDDMDAEMYLRNDIKVKSLDGKRFELSKFQKVNITGVSQDNMYRAEVSGNEVIISPKALFCALSRNSSDYRKIKDVSELEMCEDRANGYQKFIKRKDDLELVAYDCNGVTLVLFNFAWMDYTGEVNVCICDLTIEAIEDNWTIMSFDYLPFLVREGGFSYWLAPDENGNYGDELFKSIDDYCVY